MDTTHLFTTGEFAKAAHITKQTLFHYDEIGLLSPHYKDEKGYRYYSYQQYDTLIVINILKELGMTLKEIKKFIETNTPDQMLTLFREKSMEISKKMEQLRQIQTVIQTRIAVTEGAQRTDFSQITVQYAEREYLFVSSCISDESDYEFIHSISTFIGQIEQKHLNIGYPIGTMLHKDKIEAKAYTNYSFLYTKVEDSQQSVALYEKPGGLYLIGYHIGDYHTISETYDRLLKYSKEQKFTMKDFSYEEYILDSVSVRHTDAYVTKISIALA